MKKRFTNELSKEIYEQNYQMPGDETVEDTWRRVAKYLASNEKDKKYWEEEFYKLLEGFKVSTGGRILSNAGTDFKNTTMINCFVSGFRGEDQDSLQGILGELSRQAHILRSEGGYGINLDALRVRGSGIKGTGSCSPGPVAMMEMWDTQAKVITRGADEFNDPKKGKKKVRKGAQMATMSVHNPDIEDFILAKRTPGKLSNFNMSILITDDFVKAVKKKRKWKLEFPDFDQSEEIKKIYERDWVDVYKADVRKWKAAKLPVKVYKKYDDANELWDLIMEATYNRAEPGILFIDRANKMNNLNYIEHINATNPCLTADTLVYVADGRGSVTLGELARIGDDVPVFCMDNNGNPTVRMMRNPRLTGKKKKILKVTLDDGTVIRGTENHKLRGRDGSWIELKDLKKGDSLSVVTKFKNTIGPKERSGARNLYWHLNTGKFGNNKTEHSLVSEFKHGRKSVSGEHIHHVDFNSLNNSPENLVIMDAREHMKLHSERMTGDNNPMVRAQTEWSEEKWAEYSRKMSESTRREKNGRWTVSDEEVKRHALLLSKKVSGRFSVEEWKDYALKNNLPSQFSEGRSEKIGKVWELSIWAAKENGFNVSPSLDRKSEKVKERFENMGYLTKVVEGNILLRKDCFNCGSHMWVLPHRREVKNCSQKCKSESFRFTEDGLKNIKKKYEEEKKQKRVVQIKEYLDLKEKSNIVMRSDFESHCKNKGIPFRFGKRSPFQSFAELKEAASRYNHRVVSVEVDGFEDVYNGTVDEFHNFYIGGTETLDKSGNTVISYVNTRNCGEQILPVGGSCLLGSVNLVHYLNEDLSDFDYERLEKDLPIFNRMLDNVNDLSNVPLKEQKEALLNKRRIGIGYLGYGSALMILGIPYGSEKALSVTNKLAKFVTNTLYKSSAMLAKEKGAFPLFDKEKYLESNFVKKLDKDTLDLISKHGIRNSHLTSIQPTGSTSLFCNNVSGGLEPVFMLDYIRTMIIGNPPKDLTTPSIINWNNKSYEYTHNDNPNSVELVEWKWVQEGDEPMLRTVLNGVVYKIDQNRGLLREDLIEDYAVNHLRSKGVEVTGDEEWVTTAMNGKIGVKQHIDTMAVFAKYIDSAMSKTVNIPADYPFEDFKKVYMDAYDSGVIKGCTTYREGTMATVLKSTEDKGSEDVAVVTKRPEILECGIHQVSAEGKKWVVIVGLLNGKPYEVFAFPNDSFKFPFPKVEKGKLVKTKVDGKNTYDLEIGAWLLRDIISHFENHSQESVTRMASLSLRHGVELEFVVSQLMKSHGTVVSFNKAVARTLKKYLDGETKSLKCGDCGSNNMQMSEGCHKCLDCGSSKCE